MKGFLWTLVVCLAAAIAVTAAEECNVGTPLIDQVDDRMISGVWYYLLVSPKSLSEQNRCWHDIYTNTRDGEAIINSIAATPTADVYEQFDMAGTAYIVDGLNVNLTFHDYPGYSGIFYITDWNEDIGYQIIGSCPKAVNGEPVVWIGFRSDDPSLECIKAAIDAVIAADLDPDMFDRNCVTEDRLKLNIQK